MTNDSRTGRKLSSYLVVTAGGNKGLVQSTTYSVVGVRPDESRVTIVHGVSFNIAERAMKLIISGPEYKNICVEEESPATLAFSTAVPAAPSQTQTRSPWVDQTEVTNMLSFPTFAIVGIRAGGRRQILAIDLTPYSQAEEIRKVMLASRDYSDYPTIEVVSEPPYRDIDPLYLV